MMIIDEEAILHPKPDEILTLDPEAVLPYMEKLWTVEADSGRPDLDILLGAGQLTRRRKIARVEDCLTDWLRKRGDDAAWDVAGLFLMGFWSGELYVDPGLVVRLIETLQNSTLSVGSRDSVIKALGCAYYRLIDQPGIVRRIEELFRSLWAKREQYRFQPGVEATLKHVMNQNPEGHKR